MEELKNWTLKVMGDFLRSSMEPAVIQDMSFYILNIPDPDQARQELESILGLEVENHSQQSLLLRSHKLNFIDSYIEKRFAIHKKKKQKAVKVEFSKKSLEKVQKDLLGPGFVGKKMCYCMAREHELVGNCLACGKIVCAVEGRGACMFCGHQVVAKGEVPVSLPDQASYSQALKHKNKLLDYDRNAEERLAVIDDQNDWYDIAENTWLNPEDRETAAKMAQLQKVHEEAASKQTVMNIDLRTGEHSFDIGSRFIIEEAKRVNVEKANTFFVTASKNIPVNKDLNEESKEIYELIMAKLKKDSRPRTRPRTDKDQLIQHEDPFDDLVQEMPKPLFFENLVFAEADDKKQCLSMHQPWASLLVLGFKRVEGREWSTDFRGPLWIHAAAKKPSEQDIEAVVSQCREVYEGVNAPEFPQTYPTGVLLGRVELVDVLSNEQYCERKSPENKEESQSKFVFIVKNPMKLLIPIRMQGAKKIFSLDFDTWNGAKNGLRRVHTQWQ